MRTKKKPSRKTNITKTTGQPLLRSVIIVFLLSLFIPSVPFAQDGYVRPSKIVMVWDYIGRAEDNQRPEKMVAHNSLDVVSPTWFSLSNGRGDVSSLASREYVQWAHENGVKVWAVLENRSNTLMTYRALSTRSGRKRIIDQVTVLARRYNIDGINVDFEAMSRNTGGFFELFLVELHERLKPLNIILSVDIPNPVDDAQGFFNIDNIANNADYIVMMGYDQHYHEQGVTGPVASIAWVKQGIEHTLRHVSPDKVILGIPFYTRVWAESREGGRLTLTSELLGMKETFDLFAPVADFWGRDRVTGQIYAEIDRGQRRYKTWLEDNHSVSLKLDAVNDYDLAGMSAWRRGLEWEAIWNMIEMYFE